MAIFGRRFPGKSHPFGAISKPSLITTDTLTNSAAASQSLFVEATSESDIQSGSSTLALTVEAIREPNKDNSATATILTSDFQTEAEASSGTGSPTISDAISETINNQNSVSNEIIVESLAETIINSSEIIISIDEEIVTPQETDTLDNEAIAIFAINEAEAQNGDHSGSFDPTLSEEIAEIISNFAVDTPNISVDATAESNENSATNISVISDFQTEEEVNTGVGAPTITEALAEGIDSSGTGSHAIDEQSPEANLTSVAFGTQSLVETIAEAIINSADSSQTLSEALVETDNNSSTNVPSLIDLETDTPVNEGTGSHFTDGEAIAEMDTIAFLASLTMDEQRDIVVVPFSDISTGTWTVDPLYEKVDELIVASGYPTETIRSGNNPANDTAILQLSPVSDPGADDNHFINVEFYKDGAETLDFTINLKEGSNLIATRTFVDVQEIEDAPRRERIALSNGEASAIVDYSNLNIELIANKTS